jgi:hypothetical protein
VRAEAEAGGQERGQVPLIGKREGRKTVKSWWVVVAAAFFLFCFFFLSLWKAVEMWKGE